MVCTLPSSIWCSCRCEWCDSCERQSSGKHSLCQWREAAWRMRRSHISTVAHASADSTDETSRRHAHRCVAVFLWFVVKAIRLDLVSNRNIESFLAELRYYLGCWRKCAHTQTDNASNCVGTNRKIQALRTWFLSCEHKKKVCAALVKDGTEKNFILSHSACFDGLWLAGAPWNIPWE
jgi:hypothetical protein